MSGLIDSQDKGFFTFARYEFRVKMAGGKGLYYHIINKIIYIIYYYIYSFYTFISINKI